MGFELSRSAGGGLNRKPDLEPETLDPNPQTVYPKPTFFPKPLAATIYEARKLGTQEPQRDLGFVENSRKSAVEREGSCQTPNNFLWLKGRSPKFHLVEYLGVREHLGSQG